MTPEEFRHYGHQLIDRIAEYHATLAERPVMSSTKPGEIHARMPAVPPDEPERFEDVLADLDRIVMPGLTHWQHPRFFGYLGSLEQLDGKSG